MSVLVIAEPNSKEVDRGTLSAITAAQSISDNISLLVKKYIELSSSRPDVDLIVWPESALPFSLGSNKSIR